MTFFSLHAGTSARVSTQRVAWVPSASLGTKTRFACNFHIPKNCQLQKLSPFQPRNVKVFSQTEYGASWSTPGDAYVTLGLAHCFEKTDDGKLADRFVIEPITANSLECMANGAKTCFKHVFSLTLEEALARQKDVMPSEFVEGLFCENFESRCDSCARTWMRPHALENLLDLVPLGQLKSTFNYNLDDKRVLNFDNVVNDDDNIKQDLSIDVYGRKAKEEAAAALAQDNKEEEDDLDSLLAT